MPHSCINRCMLACDVGKNGFWKFGLGEKICDMFFFSTANFTNYDDCLSFIILSKHLKAFHKTETVNGISADTHTSRLS